VAASVREWLGRIGVKTLYIEPGSPLGEWLLRELQLQARDELLNGEIFTTLREAQVLIENWSGITMPSCRTLRWAIARPHRKRSCCQRLSALRSASASPGAGSTQPDSNLDGGIATRGRPSGPGHFAHYTRLLFMHRAYQWDINNPDGYANAMGKYKTHMENRFLSNHLPEERLHILDIGGGSGRFAIPLAEAGHQVTVVDSSPAAMDILRRHNHPNIITKSGDFYNQEFAEQFDAVIAIESVQCFTGIALVNLFAKIRNSLRPRGTFIFTEVNSQSWRFQLHKLRTDRISYNVTNSAGYRAALRQAGFTISEMQGFLWMPFEATSNSGFIAVFATIERIFHLSRWINQSPWLLISCSPTLVGDSPK
jgi:2-polyprenyl-3-methyl-5-hydroxy-6-metoxy-1,4-benzoquinol methylase